MIIIASDPVATKMINYVVCETLINLISVLTNLR